MKYRKKPVVIEALRVPKDGPNPAQDRDMEGWGRLAAWLQMGGCDFMIVDGLAVEIKTLEGTMRADPSDYIIRGVKGEFYPCKPDIFAATYEIVDEDMGYV